LQTELIGRRIADEARESHSRYHANDLPRHDCRELLLKEIERIGTADDERYSTDGGGHQFQNGRGPFHVTTRHFCTHNCAKFGNRERMWVVCNADGGLS